MCSPVIPIVLATICSQFVCRENNNKFTLKEPSKTTKKLKYKEHIAVS